MFLAGRTRMLALALAAAGGPLACSGAPAGPDVAVEYAWARPVAVPDSAAGGGWNSAIYLQLVNRGRTADRLMAASSEAAAAVEIHESRVEDGVMRMRPVDGVALAAGERVALEPGGLHIMLMGVTRSLVVGDTLAVTLSFEQSDSLAIRVPVEQR
jgi:copper(I)-binding protein